LLATTHLSLKIPEHDRINAGKYFHCAYGPFEGSFMPELRRVSNQRKTTLQQSHNPKKDMCPRISRKCGEH